MRDQEPTPRIIKTSTLKYFYTTKEGLRLEANLETHFNHDIGPVYISNSSFKDFANNLGINLDEFRFKYSTVSEVCEHMGSVSERCYDYSKVFYIFTALKAGLVETKNHLCCYSEMPLCSAEARDEVCRYQISTYPAGFPVNGGECLLNDDVYWMLSRQRLSALGIMFYRGEKEFTLEKDPSDYFAWSRYWKKRKRKIKKAARLDNQTSIIYRDIDNVSDYY
jgi:hypothetical protein